MFIKPSQLFSLWFVIIGSIFCVNFNLPVSITNVRDDSDWRPIIPHNTYKVLKKNDPYYLNNNDILKTYNKLEFHYKPVENAKINHHGSTGYNMIIPKLNNTLLNELKESSNSYMYRNHFSKLSPFQQQYHKSAVADYNKHAKQPLTSSSVRQESFASLAPIYHVFDQNKPNAHFMKNYPHASYVHVDHIIPYTTITSHDYEYKNYNKYSNHPLYVSNKPIMNNQHVFDNDFTKNYIPIKPTKYKPAEEKPWPLTVTTITPKTTKITSRKIQVKKIIPENILVQLPPPALNKPQKKTRPYFNHEHLPSHKLIDQNGYEVTEQGWIEDDNMHLVSNPFNFVYENRLHTTPTIFLPTLNVNNKYEKEFSSTASQMYFDKYTESSSSNNIIDVPTTTYPPLNIYQYQISTESPIVYNEETTTIKPFTKKFTRQRIHGRKPKPKKTTTTTTATSSSFGYSPIITEITEINKQEITPQKKKTTTTITTTTPSPITTKMTKTTSEANYSQKFTEKTTKTKFDNDSLKSSTENNNMVDEEITTDSENYPSIDEINKIKAQREHTVGSIKTPKTTTIVETSSKSTTTSKRTRTRPRFSIKDFKKKTTGDNSSTTTTTTNTPTTISRRKLYPKRTKPPQSEQPKNLNSDQVKTRNRFSTKRRITTSTASTIEENTPVTFKGTDRTNMLNSVKRGTLVRIKQRILKKNQKTPEESVNSKAEIADLSGDNSDHFYSTIRHFEEESPNIEEDIDKRDSLDFDYDSEIENDKNKDKDKNDTFDMDSFMQSQMVSNLTLASPASGNNNYAIRHQSRKVPPHFTLATDDPILPIEAFFPKILHKKSIRF